MENEEQNMQNQNALSIYGQSEAAMDDFPVLKAFQQYIDAEQSKSRKRMILLCMFFGVLMTILVTVFVLMISQINRDKQQANEQLIQFLMKERDRTNVQSPFAGTDPVANDAMKAMTATLTALREEIAEQKKAAAEEALLAPTKAELELQRKTELANARLRREQEKLEAEKRRLAAEKEELRLQEVERQRRRLYPEYYGKGSETETPSRVAAEPAQPLPQNKTPLQSKPRRQLTDDDIDDILREVDSLRAADEEKAKAENKKKTRRDGKKKADDDLAKDDQPIEYFTDAEYALPVKVNGEDAGWSLPLPSEEED